MMILDVEVIGQHANDAPTEKLAERIAEKVTASFGIPAGQLAVKVAKLYATSYAENGAPLKSMPIFVRVLVKTRDPAVWPKRAEAIAAAVSSASGRAATSVHVIFEPDATGRVFLGHPSASAAG